MSLTYPRTDLLAGVSFSPRSKPFQPMWRTESSRTAGGVTRIASLGPMLWRGNWMTVPVPVAEAMRIEAGLISLGGGVNLFEGHDPRHPAPAADDGTMFAGLTVHAISGDRRELRINGLPANFTMSAGDWVSVNDGTNLHLLRLLEGGDSNLSLITPFLTVEPALRDTILVGNALSVRQASARWQIERDSVVRSPVGHSFETVAWSAIQVIE